MKQKEVEIASSTEHLTKETFYSLVNINRVSVSVQLQASEGRTPAVDDLTERGWASDAVTSRSPLFPRLLYSR